MRIYAIVVFLILFGAMNTCFNEMGVFGTHAAEHNVGISETNLEAVQEGLTSGGENPLDAISLALSAGKIIFGGLKTALCIIPLLMEWGIPLPIAALLQTPIWFVYAFESTTYFMGRSSKGVG